MRLVNYYQLWMHEVFPKAKFRDCIQMTEKAGHETRLRMMRKEWIGGTKARVHVPAEEPDWDALQALVDGDKAREAAWEAKEREGAFPVWGG
jgi:Replication Fork Protection Component Swi3